MVCVSGASSARALSGRTWGPRSFTSVRASRNSTTTSLLVAPAACCSGPSRAGDRAQSESESYSADPVSLQVALGDFSDAMAHYEVPLTVSARRNRALHKYHACKRRATPHDCACGQVVERQLAQGGGSAAEGKHGNARLRAMLLARRAELWGLSGSWLQGAPSTLRATCSRNACPLELPSQLRPAHKGPSMSRSRPLW